MAELIYEHRVLVLTTLKNLEVELNRQGAQGWNLYQIIQDGHHWLAVFAKLVVIEQPGKKAQKAT